MRQPYAHEVELFWVGTVHDDESEHAARLVVS